MAKKERKLAKAAADRTARWTVRGVAPRLQKAAGDHARMRGQTLGQWLSEVVEAAVAEPADLTATAGGWRQAMEARLERLEAAVAADGPADRSRAGGRSPAGSGVQPSA